MPICLNNSKKSYKGTEPSPKGLGYCAGEMKVGEKKKGKDGNMWVIKQVKNGSKRWIKLVKDNIKKDLKYNFNPSKNNEKLIYNLHFENPEYIENLTGLKFKNNKHLTEKQIKKAIKRVKEKDFQNKIIKIITKKVPKSLIHDYQLRVGNVDKKVIEEAIKKFINGSYNKLSIFDFNIYYLYNSKGKDWSVFTDTSPREIILENIYLILTKKKKIDKDFIKFFPVK